MAASKIGSLDAGSLKELAAGEAKCRACPLWERATQAVPGEGSPNARIVAVGEQPGDQEDLVGKPFVGPAGRVLDEALERAGVDRRDLYVTNAVKHFSWELRGKRRLHKTPTQQELAACQEWLLGEIRLIEPELIVCLGGTAVRAVLGPKIKVLANRGQFLESPFGIPTLVTVHPSSILRVPTETRDEAFAALVADLERIRDRPRPKGKG
jgi:uracil-DNA glycosylase family protein